MNSIKYIGMDVHAATISVAVLDAAGKLIMESIIETKSSTILQFICGFSGDVHLTFEEGTWAAWLFDLLKPRVTKIVVCNPHRNALLREGNKSDQIDARKLADLLRTNMLRPVYHGEKGPRTLKELARGYITIGKDLTRVMNRVKAIYRGWGIPCHGQTVYSPRHRDEWLSKITHPGVRRRAQLYYQQLMAILETPNRFRNKRVLWKSVLTIAMCRDGWSDRRNRYPSEGSTPITITNSKNCSRALQSKPPHARVLSASSTRLG
jgi:hypothetical protein